jgi:transcriptional regulator with XRE-family HTH domain
MPKVVPLVLKQLRKTKGWTQEELAERAKLDKQTICRLEAESSGHAETRQHTVDGLANALRADPSVLTGRTPLTATQDDEGPLAQMSRLNFRVSTQARNALYLISERYDVAQSAIVELAPYLFCWAAEASLRQRKERVARAESALQAMRDADSAIGHLEASDFSEIQRKIEAEKDSIKFHDIWGTGTEFAAHSTDWAFDNPFAVFLESLANDIEGDTTFDEYGMGDFPFYRVCPEDALDLVGGDAELADAILQGHIPLHQLPKELRDPIKTKERVVWARTKLEAYQHALQNDLRNA